MISINTGIEIIMNDWLSVKKDELIHFISDENHIKEIEAFTKFTSKTDSTLRITVLQSHQVQNGNVIEEMTSSFKDDDVIIGATDFSFITTSAVTKAIKNGSRFLSLPLSCTNNTSLLENDFIKMDPKIAYDDAQKILKKLKGKDTIHVTTKLGTDLTFSIKDRIPGYFNGCATKPGQIGSASFEAYIAPLENSMNGVLYLDGSFGYLGTVKKPIKIEFVNGKLVNAESEDDGAKKLLDYIKSFNDEKMYKPGEFGIGLNRKSKCRGICYIEDESTYSTFHIGMGRNITLGGKQKAAGHFDIVTHKPTIEAGKTTIMKNGELI